MSDANNFQISKGNVRQLSEEEKAFIEGRDAQSKSILVGSTPAEAASGIMRMVPDGKGGFRPVTAPAPDVEIEAAGTQPERNDTDTASHAQPEQVAYRTVNLQDEGVIRIKDAKKRVDLVCAGKFGDRDGVFSVGMSAVSVDITPEGVSVLVRAEVDVYPPTLCNMLLRVDGAEYQVLYAGGKHRLGGYINMPFVRV